MCSSDRLWTALLRPSWEAVCWIPQFYGAGAASGDRWEPLSCGFPWSVPSSAQRDVRTQCHGVTCPTCWSRFPGVPVPRGQHTHQLDALGKGVVFPVLLRKTLEYLSLSIPTPCRDKRGIRGQAAGTQPAFQPLVTPGWKQHRHTPALCQPSMDMGSTEQTPAPSTNTAVWQHCPYHREKQQF